MHRIKDVGIEKIRCQFSKDRNEDKKKVLEYLACDKPVITTRKGIEGIRTRKNVIIKNSIREFSEAITNLINFK